MRSCSLHFERMSWEGTDLQNADHSLLLKGHILDDEWKLKSE